MATAPVYASTPALGTYNIPATANTARDGTGTLTTVVAGHANGGVLRRIVFCATGTTTAGVIRVFSKVGSVFSLIKELPVTAATPSGTVQAWTGKIVFSPEKVLAPNELIVVGTHNAEAFAANAEWGTF